MNIAIFGAPGSGKGTQSAKLIDEYGLYHISTGELLRDHIKRGTELGRTADEFISKGQLIPDDLMIRILDDVLDSEAAAKTAWCSTDSPAPSRRPRHLRNYSANAEPNFMR